MNSKQIGILRNVHLVKECILDVELAVKDEDYVRVVEELNEVLNATLTAMEGIQFVEVEEGDKS